MSTKKTFISWSGEKSKKLASAIRDWLPTVIQAVRPYFSPDDIVKGARWSAEIAEELSQCSVGLICVTRENLNSSWIMFEAGALSKQLDRSRVCPIIFDLKATDLTGPLAQFQAASFEKSEILGVMQMINSELGENQLEENVLNTAFEKFWPDLKKQVDLILSDPSDNDSSKEIRSDREIIEEILSIARSPISRLSGTDLFAENAENLVIAMESLTARVCQSGLAAEFYDELRTMRSAVIFLLSISGSHVGHLLKHRLDVCLTRLEESLPASHPVRAWRTMESKKNAEQKISPDG